ncbi:hypothetical protein [Cereibacter azotoformans]|uniref:Phage tail protein n=1 Tax=Cereibacter azotoformans TaxID=43057 RepID=A0A2T5K722_9RHOB|nr:hypothetical protein [Cereibacter azotoformans]MBO4169549.1 hypothetical protein [Cereibacter azotoformans]PTR18226.1 hypothetical protein C8J28_109186 [Cereibacter azotoformans]
MSFLDPVSNDYVYIPGSQGYFVPAGETDPVNLGFIDAAEIELAVEEQEKKGLNSNGVRVVVKKELTSVNATVKLTLGSLTDFNRALSLMGDAGTSGAAETFQLGDKVFQIEAGGHKSGIASNAGIRGQLVLRGVNPSGKKALVVLWDVELRPSSARSLTGEDFGSIEVSGTAYPVSGKPTGEEIGMERTLTGEVTDAA